MLNDFKKILICGDSYGITDPDYPGLHWSEKLNSWTGNLSITNLSTAGYSNALITLQLLQGLKLNPDFVILLFTNENRYELDNNINTVPFELTGDSLLAYQRERYTTNHHNNDPAKIKIINQYMIEAASPAFEKLKNYFYISFCLNTLRSLNIPFCFSLGGFEYQQDYTALINQNYLPNFIMDYKQNELNTNLWYYGRELTPIFHVGNEKIQELFANECLERIKKETNC